MIHSIVPQEIILGEGFSPKPERESLVMGVRVSLRGQAISRIISSNPRDYMRAAALGAEAPRAK